MNFTTFLLFMGWSMASLSLAFPKPLPSLRRPRTLHSRSSLPFTNSTISPSVVTQFPNNTWLENLAIRPNGQIIISLITTPALYLVDPLDPSEHVLLGDFPQFKALLGITSFVPDEYYFVAGNFTSASSQDTVGVGSYAIMKLNMRPSTPVITKVLDMPRAAFLNGLEVLSAEDGLLICADSTLGLVWWIDVFKGTYEVLIDIPEMKYSDPNFLLGVNGIHLRDGYLYYTSMSQELFCRIPITATPSNATSGAPFTIGSNEILATGIFGDDFIFDRQGNAWIVQDPLDMLTLVITDGKAKGEVFTVAGMPGSDVVAGGTACRFGKMETDEDILYVVTNGGLAAPPTTGIVGGKVLAFDTAGYVAKVLG
ncbi:calcium-dependent phosphotriesterase-2 [Coleophoma crateriformis]|uniref:Calcium-dependent phosphotriesterase-2 n=1 Tax=Coleophoma crateriformis TaxID=565419 RepID=A0A3D8T1N0_9HELO|nr:calcium-dependent phosphotriesterase-2 [Coleophoma crateriformis]